MHMRWWSMQAKEGESRLALCGWLDGLANYVQLSQQNSQERKERLLLR